MMAWAAAIGVMGGLAAAAYYFVLSGGLHLIWRTGLGLDPHALPIEAGFRPAILLVTTLGGLLVGLTLHFMGVPGEISAVVDNIHVEHGRLDMRQTPSMTVASLNSIIAGGSAGPEAPLVQIIGSLGSWIGDRLRLPGPMVRTLTFCGMGTALGAFFGAPVAGALFALEIPHRRGLEYYEALIPAAVSAIIGFLVFRSLVGYEGPLYHLPALAGEATMSVIACGAVFGVLGAGAAAVFATVFASVERLTHRLAHRRILLATLGGLLIGLIAQVAPKTLFWGEFQIQSMIEAGTGFATTHGPTAAAALVVFIGFAKILAVACTLHFGFRGGFIFPLFFVGAACGMGASLLIPQLPMPVAIVCTMAAVNVAVTKTPISTTVLLATLANVHLLPAIALASFTSFLLTTRVRIIRSQRSRDRLPHPGEDVIGSAAHRVP